MQDQWHRVTLATSPGNASKPPTIYCRRLSEDRTLCVEFNRGAYVFVLRRGLVAELTARHEPVTDAGLLRELEKAWSKK